MADEEKSLALDMAGTAADAVTFPGAGALLKYLSSPVGREWQRRRSVALEAAEVSSGLQREELEELLKTDPEVIGLHTRLLFAAGMNGHDHILRMMGTVLGTAVADRERVDECEIISTAIADLNAAHFTLLELLSEEPPRPEPDRAVLWTMDSLVAQERLPRTVTVMTLGTLVGRGLATMDSGYGLTYRISELGQELLAVAAKWSRVHAER